MADKSPAFNSLSLKSALDSQVDRIMEKFGQMPHQLLLRCVQFQRARDEQKALNIDLTAAEATFLQKNFIAEVKSQSVSDYGGGSDTYYTLSKFLPPWEGMLSELAAGLKQPSVKRPQP